GRADGELDEPGRAGVAGVGVGPVGAVLRPGGVAAEAAAGRDVLVGQDRREGADRGRLGGPLLATDQHAAALRGDRTEQQRGPQLVGADEGGEGIAGGVRTRPVHGCLLASVHARRTKDVGAGSHRRARLDALASAVTVTVAGPLRTCTGFLLGAGRQHATAEAGLVW